MDEKYLNKILDMCENFEQFDDVPVAAIVVYNNKIIGEGVNTKEITNDITGHAEINAIREAEKHLNTWKLYDCDLYVTLEPCNMCKEVIKQSRIRNVYYLVEKYSYKTGYNKTKFEYLQNSKFDKLKANYQQKIFDFFELKCNR